MSAHIAIPEAQAQPAPSNAVPFVAPEPLERRRLRAYLAQMLSDITAIFGGFGAAGYLYLGWQGLDQALVLAQLLLPVYLTLALYNAAYSLAGLQSAASGARRAILSLAMSAAVVVFFAFYTKSSAEFSRVLFTAGTLFVGGLMVWARF